MLRLDGHQVTPEVMTVANSDKIRLPEVSGVTDNLVSTTPNMLCLPNYCIVTALENLPRGSVCK